MGIGDGVWQIMAKTVYSNLERARKYLSLASQNTADDEQIFGYLHRASRSIDSFTRRFFYPLSASYAYDYDQSQELRLDRDLISLDSLKTQNGACTVSQNALYLMTGNNYNYPPYDRIVLRSDSGSLLYYSGTDQKANVVTGIFGYHEHYDESWVDTGTSLAGSVNTTATSISLAGAGSYGTDASDINFEAPRMAIGDTLKIEDEFVFVVGGGSSGNANPLVIRAQNGTSANNHPSGAAIYRFSPEPDIQWATERLTAWLYGQQSTPYETKTAYVNIGGISIPGAWGVDIKDKIKRYIRTTLVIYPDRH